MTPEPGILGNPYGRWIHGIGSRPDRPFRFAVPMYVFSFGDVFNFVSAAARIAANFDHSLCTFFVNDDRPFFEDIINMYPNQKTVAKFKGDWSQMPYTTINGWVKNYDTSDPFYQDLVLSTVMLTNAIFPWMPSVSLKISQTLVPGAQADLINRGLDPERWFCTIHWREPNYRHKPLPNFRDADPKVYLRAIDYIIDEMGGQVVQLGHPEMRRRGRRPGYVDLSSEENSWTLQAFAVSRSRFFVGSPSGGAAMAQSFCTPSAHIDVLDWYAGASSDVIVTPRVRVDDGPELRQEALFQSGLMSSHALSELSKAGHQVHVTRSSIGEIIEALRMTHSGTAEIEGWREPATSRLSPTNCFQFPVPVGSMLRFVAL